jgi:hypothetical protein
MRLAKVSLSVFLAITKSALRGKRSDCDDHLKSIRLNLGERRGKRNFAPSVLSSVHRCSISSRSQGMRKSDGGRGALSQSGNRKTRQSARTTKVSRNTDSWSMSAYTRDTALSPEQNDTIFRGSVADSPVGTLELTIDGVPTRFPAQSGAQEEMLPSPFSQAESDPFSDYRSYESDQGGTEIMRDEVPNRPAQKKNQPRLQCDTTFSNDPVRRLVLNRAIPIMDRSPLDTLRRSLRTPAEVPQSPSPFSLKRVHDAPMRPSDSPFRDQNTPYMASAQSTDTWYAKAPGFSHSNVAQPIPPSFSGAAPPNFSLPAANHRSATAAIHQRGSQQDDTRGSFGLWYLRSAPMIACISTAAAAICLAVCSLSSKSGASLLATVPAKAFVGLEGTADKVELHSSMVCLLRNVVSSPT